MGFDTEIFKGKTLSELFSEIYDNSKKKDNQISTLISELKPLIEDIGDATLVVPLIKEYLEIGVKNDEQLVKIATIVQRMESSTVKGSSDDWFNSDEIQALLEETESISLSIDQVKQNTEVEFLDKKEN